MPFVCFLEDAWEPIVLLPFFLADAEDFDAPRDFPDGAPIPSITLGVRIAPKRLPLPLIFADAILPPVLFPLEPAFMDLPAAFFWLFFASA